MSKSDFSQLSNYSINGKEKDGHNLTDVLQNLDDLNQIAFEACMKAFRANGNLNSYQFLLLSHLKYIFSITTEMAKRISRRIANDIELITIAEKKKMSEYDEEKSCSILKRLYTIKQEPFVLDRYKHFLEEIGVNLSTEDDQIKTKKKCGRPKKDTTNNNKDQTSETSNKKNKQIDKSKINDAPNIKLEKRKTKEPETSYVGNLGKKEMHTMICQRVIPISDTYKRKIINRSIVLRKRVALGEMTAPIVPHTSESSKNSESNTAKEISSTLTQIKRQKLDSPLSDETDGKSNEKISKNPALPKTPSFKFIRKPVFSSEKNSPKFVIRPINCTGNNVYSVPRVVFEANNSTTRNLTKK
uniref:ENT domain-containing protein n=1 Tax=Strongyloides stercoralis TaxID=6248 RepID=A0AAF5CT00_STRER